MTAVPEEFRIGVEQLKEAAKTFVIAASQYDSTRIRQELIGFSGPGVDPSDWIVEARRKDAKEFLIWSEEHRGWWAPGRHGYVQERSAAGRYSFDEAIDIIRGANIHKNDVPNEAIVLADDPAV